MSFYHIWTLIFANIYVWSLEAQVVKCQTDAIEHRTHRKRKKKCHEIMHLYKKKGGWKFEECAKIASEFPLKVTAIFCLFLFKYSHSTNETCLRKRDKNKIERLATKWRAICNTTSFFLSIQPIVYCGEILNYFSAIIINHRTYDCLGNICRYKWFGLLFICFLNYK